MTVLDDKTTCKMSVLDGNDDKHDDDDTNNDDDDTNDDGHRTTGDSRTHVL